MIDCSAGTVAFIFQLPSVLSLIVHQFRIVVPFVKIFEDRRQDLRLFIRQIDSSRMVLQKLAFACSLEEGGPAKNFFMSSKKPIVTADAYGDDGRGEGADERACQRNSRVNQWV